MSFLPADLLANADRLIDALLGLLLVATVGYLWLINRRLSELRGTQSSLPALLQQASGDIDRAERGLREMHGKAGTVIENLAKRHAAAEKQESTLRDAAQMANLLSQRLDDQIGMARALSRQLREDGSAAPAAAVSDADGEDTATASAGTSMPRQGLEPCPPLPEADEFAEAGEPSAPAAEPEPAEPAPVAAWEEPRMAAGGGANRPAIQAFFDTVKTLERS